LNQAHTHSTETIANGFTQELMSMWTLSTPSQPADDEINIDIVYIEYGESAPQPSAISTSQPAPGADQDPATDRATTGSVCWPQCQAISSET
jgi:hypothetical protein